jgi:uncharacterized protein YlxW (UPF0749 family)
MTLLGKFFTAVIFLLSAVFLFAALAVNASHRNWRQYVLEGVNGELGLKTQIENLTRNRNQLEDEKRAIQTSLDREQASRRTALASLQTQLDQLQGELIQSQSRVQQLTAQSTNLIQLDASRTQQLDQLIKENVDLRESVRKEQQNRDQLFTQTLKLTDEANQLRGFKQQLEERNRQLLAQVTRYEEVVTSKGIDINEPLDGAPPQRNGKVLVVNRPNQLVLVSIGYDEGLRQGHLLEVTRAGKYVGKLRVSKTEPDRSVAEILEDFSELTLQEGDRVDTTFE